MMPRWLWRGGSVRIPANGSIHVVAGAGELFHLAADKFSQAARLAVDANDRFAVCLAGGSTPRGLYSFLAANPGLLPWERTHFFWGDERHVPPDHLASNYRMAWDAMLSKAPVPPENIHRIRGECAGAGQAALEYERTLRGFFDLGPGQLPRFDLVLLGMGPDGHTASLVPGTAALEGQRRLVVPNWVAKLNAERITLTAPVLNHAAHVLFLVRGDDKAKALKAVLEGPHDPERFPAQLIHPEHGKLLWLVDRAAASLLGKG